MGRGRTRITDDVRRELIRLAALGMPRRVIIESVDVSAGSLSAVLRPFGGVYRPEQWAPSPARLSARERELIEAGLQQGASFRAIGRQLGRSPSTISREVGANGGRGGYQPLAAHLAARQRARRPKPTKLAADRRLCARVAADLERLWSPQQIAQRLRADFGDDVRMRISHETIYKSIYVQGRGELRRELARCLRSGRARRKQRGRIETRGKIPNMVMISQRPAEAADRAVPGHWEGDLLMGAANSAIGTLVERSTRYVLLLHLPDGRGAEQVRTAIQASIQTLPQTLRRTLTWDQGSEMAQHAAFSVDTGVQVYFCDPHSPWQRGSNENTNGLLRQYFPKGTDLAARTADELQAAADSVNGRPRQTLDWMTPSEKLAELLVATTG